MPYKQAILVRTDLRLPKGKLAVQAAHAAVEGVLQSKKEAVNAWRDEGMAKVVLRVANETELMAFLDTAKAAGLVALFVSDAGRTVVPPGTVTCGVIGPDEAAKIDAIVGRLRLL